MSWQPHQDGVQQITGLLTEFQKPGADQAKIFAQLEQCRAIPDFNNYLAFIFASGEGLPIEVRQSAGLLLKNNIHTAPLAGTPPEVKTAVLAGLRLSDRALRHTAGTCLVAIAAVGGSTSGSCTAWPELPAALAAALDSGVSMAIDGALDSVYKLYEEAPICMEGETPQGSGKRGSDEVIPRVLTQFSRAEPALRALAVSAVNLAVPYMPPSLQANLQQYIQGLFSLAHDSAPAVRKAVCAGLVQLIAIVPDRLESQLGGVIEYMLASTQDAEESVAVEACEFWSAYPESGLDVGILRPYLPRLLPVLLKNMVYDEYDEEVADAEAAEEEALAGRAGGRDRDADIKPHIHANSGAGHGGVQEDGEDDDEEDGEVARWNLRRCSAAGLDMLSASFGDEILPLLLPQVHERLAGADWRARESAILALGAVSDGCASGLAQHLPGIAAALVPALQDPRPMVRCIACWSLTRYSRGLLDRAREGDRGLLDSVVAGVCQKTTDHNRRVQEAACSSLGAIIEEAQNNAVPYAGQILGALGSALHRYGRRSLRYAYDAVTTIAEHFPAALQAPEGAILILPPLFSKLASLPDGDRDLLPLLECVASVAQAAGPQLQPYADSAFARCVTTADSMGAGAAGGAFEKDDADEFIVGCLDAVSGMVEGLGAGVESLVGRSALPQVLVRCCADVNPDVRQSAFALVGDIATTCCPHLMPVFGDIVGSALASLEPQAITHQTVSACNNAAWALGELAVGCAAPEVAQFALPALERLARIITAPSGGLPRSLVENAAIAVGRISWTAADVVAPHAGAFVGPWCMVLRALRDGLEKEHAFLGLCALLRTNPAAGAAAFASVCEAVVSWRTLTCEGLRNELNQVMAAYKAQLVAMGQWEAALGSMTPQVASKLVEMCQLH